LRPQRPVGVDSGDADATARTSGEDINDNLDPPTKMIPQHMHPLQQQNLTEYQPLMYPQRPLPSQSLDGNPLDRTWPSCSPSRSPSSSPFVEDTAQNTSETASDQGLTNIPFDPLQHKSDQHIPSNTSTPTSNIMDLPDPWITPSLRRDEWHQERAKLSSLQSASAQENTQTVKMNSQSDLLQDNYDKHISSSTSFKAQTIAPCKHQAFVMSEERTAILI
jgi:hypothetical protein